MENPESKLNIIKRMTDVDKAAIEKKYMSIFQIAQSFGFNKHPERRLREDIVKFCCDYGIEVIQTQKPIKRNTLFFKISDLNRFLEEYISADELVQIYDISLRELYYIRTYGNTKNMHTFKVGQKIFHPRQEIFEAIETRKNFESNELISSKEIMSRLGIFDSHLLSTLRKEEGLQYFGDGRYSTKLYVKAEIERLEAKQQDFKKNYYSSDQVTRLIGYRPTADFIQPAPITPTVLLKAALVSKGSPSVTFYYKKEIDEYVRRKSVKESKSQLITDDGLSSYEMLCTAEAVFFSEKNKETSSAWENFVKDKFYNSTRNNKSGRDLITLLLNCKKILVNFTKDKELSDFTANDINIGVLNADIPITVKQKLYNFFREYHQNYLAQGKKIFTLNHLLNPYKFPVINNKKLDLYTYEEYEELLFYVADVEKHKSIAIDDAIKKVGKRKTVHYAGMWLFTLIHFNNAWRAMDVITCLPRVDRVVLERLGIHSLEHFKNVNLDYDEAKQIVYQYQIQEYVMNKNGNTNRFHCSELLTRAFATSVIICTLISNDLYPEIKLQNDNNQRIDHLFHFGTNSLKPLRIAYNGFFESFKNNDSIRFESKKMNRTLLVFMYLILSQNGMSAQALEVSKRLRSHYDYETTNIYLTIPNEELDFLVDHLFRRGSFGYIPKMLSHVVLSKEKQDGDFEKETEQILAIKNVFNGIEGIEAISGFINHIIANKISVADKILSLNREEAEKILFEIQTNIIPSRQENIMCLKGKEGCAYPNKDDEDGPCHGCPYAIPNFYSIASLVIRIKETLKEFKDTFEDLDGYEFEKRKLVNHLFLYLDEFHAAKAEFGEVVYKFFERGKEEYNEYLDLIDLVNLKDKPLEYYLTYEPKYI